MTRNKAIPIVMAALVALALSGCPRGSGPDGGPSTPAVTAPSPEAQRPTLSGEFVDRIDGSTATIPLMTAALRLLRGSADGMVFNTTPAAYDNLIAGTKDVIFVTPPSEEELAAAREAGVEMEVIPIVKDALVFLVNTANPVQGLTREQIKDVYSGKVTNWSEVGGGDQAIVGYQRPINSGSQTLFLQLAMAGTKPMNAPEEIRPGGMDGLMDVISAYDNSERAIGFSVFYYTQEMYTKDNVRLLAIDGVAPTRQTIADGSYPYGTHYYAVVRKDEPAGSPARQLIDWCLSAEGQRTFSAAAYVPLDAANIVPADDGFGYGGSTLENTTQSAGTGGPAGQIAPFDANICVDSVEFTNACILTDGQDRFLGLAVPGFPQAEAAATAWLEALPPAETPVVYYGENNEMSLPSQVRHWASSARGLLVVERMVEWSGFELPPFAGDAAVFRLADGHRMALSDFFYDGVNYIDFINRHLLNEGTNQQLVVAQQDAAVGERAAPFTGLPSTTLDFSYDAGKLVFQFPTGNPFLYNTALGLAADSFVPLNLPLDLSPYGSLWRMEAVRVGNFTIDHVVRTYQDPDPRDGVLNQAIDAWVTGHDQGDTAVAELWVSDSEVSVWVRVLASGREYVDDARFDFMTGERTD